MKNNFSIGFFAVLSVLILRGSISYSWGQVQDAVLWKEINIEKKFTKRIALTFKEQFRLDNNFSSFNSDVMQAALQVDFGKHFSITPGYRITLKTEETNHRPYFDVDYSQKIKESRFSVNGRLRLQRDIGRLILSSNTIRTRIQLNYNVPKIPLTPNIGTELFFQADNIEKEFSRYRLQTGLGYKIRKQNFLDLAYYYQRDVNDGPPEISHIWIIGIRVLLD